MSAKKTQLKKVCCPKCHCTDNVGFLSGSTKKKYFCSGPDCCIEFDIKDKEIKIYDIIANGTVKEI